MFNVILRNMAVYFKYFKQFGTQTLSKVSVSHPFGQARSMSSKYCSACRTPWDVLAFLRFLFLPQTHGMGLCPLPVPGSPVAPFISP